MILESLDRHQCNLERLARADGYHTIAIEAHEEKPLGALVAPYLRQLLYELERMAGVGDKVKRGLAVLRSFIGALKVTVDDIMIYSPAHGDMAFTVPLFDEFMVRAIPEFKH